MENKPKFISKKEREERKRNEEEKSKQEKEIKSLEIKRIRKEYQSFNNKDHLRRQREAERQQRRQSRSRSKSRSRSREGHSYVTSNTRATIAVKLKGEDKELQSIKYQYLGLNKEKKKLLKPSEKFKNIFNFEWDANEDTSYDTNPLYSNRLDSNLLFGRGFRAGIDVREQKKHSCDYESLIRRYDETYASKKDKKERKDKKEKKDELDKIVMKTLKHRIIGESVHWSQKKNEDLNERDWRIFREDHDIIIKGGRVPKPMRTWDESCLNAKIMDSIRQIGYKAPTPIQIQAIPIGLERKDLIGIAPTGSGKSAAFLIPLITYLSSLPPLDDETCKEGPYGLILSPTRELAVQIDNEFQKFAFNTPLRSIIVVGGRKTEEQAFHLRKGCEVLIGTPGRIKDALQSRFTVLNQCNWVILDEADKMIDLGFDEDVNFILDSIPQTNLKSENENIAELQEKISKTGEKVYRVTHLFSATMPSSVERLARKYLRSFCYISIGEPGGGKKEIDQKIEFIAESQKKQRLQNILENYDPPIIVFANQKKEVELISKFIEKWGWRSVIYHGGKTQEQREAAVNGFKNRKYDILVATDLAGRGLDVDGVKMVVNFDAPKNIQDFIHRTGRTGRAGKKGLAATFLTNHDEDLFYDLKEFLLKNNQEVPQELALHPAAKIKPGTIPENVPRRKQILYVQ